MERHLDRSGGISLHALPSDGVVNLREWHEGDIPALTDACRDLETQRWTLVPQNYTDEHARNFIVAARQGCEQRTSVELAAVDATTDRVLGAVGLVSIVPGHERAKIEYWTAPKARRRGVASRAVRLLSSWAFAELQLVRLDLACYLDNFPSQCVAQRAGYRYEGVLRSFYMTAYGREAVVLFSRLRDDPYPGQRYCPKSRGSCQSVGWEPLGSAPTVHRDRGSHEICGWPRREDPGEGFPSPGTVRPQASGSDSVGIYRNGK